MRKSIVVALAVYASVGAGAGKLTVFAHFQGPQGLSLLYRETCPIDDPKDWKAGNHINPDGSSLRTCWAKDLNKVTKTEIVTICPITVQNRKDVIRPGGCQMVSASKFVKGNPILERAF